MPRLAAMLFALICALTLTPFGAQAASPAPGQAAESIRAELVAAQIAAGHDPAAAQAHLAAANQAYATLAEAIAAASPAADQQARAGLDDAARALDAGDLTALASARARIWTAVLGGGSAVVEQAAARGDTAMARAWLAVREFRHATRFSRPNADATLALSALEAGTSSPDDALASIRADLLDTYQARLAEALTDTRGADRQGFAARRAEAAALAEGYFAILAPAYAEQRGEQALSAARQHFAQLTAAALAQADVAAAADAAEQAISGFRAAPLSAAEQARRAGQLLRFLSLVPVEYGRGVRNGAVAVDLEIREAVTFRDGAAAAFADLRPALEQIDAARAGEVAALLADLERDLATATPSAAVDPAVVQGKIDRATTLLREVMPAEWQRDNGADFDVIQAALDQMEAAVKGGQYDLAESARLEAYAILESGPEAKLIVFAPEYKTSLENLFWYGADGRSGLAALIANHAPASEISATRKALNSELAAAEQAIAGNNAPVSVAGNAAIIVFREGLEAVLILASLMGSLKSAAQRSLRRPLWAGTAAAFVASILTWLLAQGALSMLAAYGEKLEAVVSLVAIGVLLLITNWFFHDVYWKGWMANFHAQKRKIIGGTASQWLGLAMLGFASVYREGFETVLFLQALVLESGPAIVLAGTAAGLGGTLLVGLVVFRMQARLPYKKMLIVTGVLIGAVLLQMVGNTVHIMQVVGWLPLHPIRSLTLPHWAGFWFGLYTTWEGILLQAASAVFVIGSYYLAESLQKREQTAAATRSAVAGTPPYRSEQKVDPA